MKKIINYSFIIPHKNSPTYLVRCLNSIPDREDVQVIVVDDNSDSDIVNWDKFEIQRRGKFEIVRTTCGKGAGYARNVGISKAVGKWLVFPDADDYYKDDFLSILDTYKDSEHDVVYFNFDRIEESGEILPPNKIVNYIDSYDESQKALDIIKYRINPPWMKMVRKSFIQDNDITFEEVSIGNDLFYSLQVGYFTINPLVIKDKIYNYVQHMSSMTNRNYNKCKILTQFNLVYKSAEFFKFVNYKQWAHGLVYVIYVILRSHSVSYIFKSMFYLFTNYFKIISNRSEYVDKILLVVKRRKV